MHGVTGSARMRKREQRAREAERLYTAADKVRAVAPTGFAGLDEETGEGLAGLLQAVAEGREDVPDRVWEHGQRVAERFLEPTRGTYQVRPLAHGPVPAGYTSATVDRTDYPVNDAGQPERGPNAPTGQ